MLNYRLMTTLVLIADLCPLSCLCKHFSWSHFKMNTRLKKCILWLLYAPRIPRDVQFCLFNGCRWDSGLRLFGLPIIRRHRRGHLSIGKRFTACSDPRHNILGVFQRVTITVGRNASLIIGEDVGVSGCTISAMSSVRVGGPCLARFGMYDHGLRCPSAASVGPAFQSVKRRVQADHY
jgi:hypothetical protein